MKTILSISFLVGILVSISLFPMEGPTHTSATPSNSFLQSLPSEALSARLNASSGIPAEVKEWLIAFSSDTALESLNPSQKLWSFVTTFNESFDFDVRPDDIATDPKAYAVIKECFQDNLKEITAALAVDACLKEADKLCAETTKHELNRSQERFEQVFAQGRIGTKEDIQPGEVCLGMWVPSEGTWMSRIVKREQTFDIPISCRGACCSGERVYAAFRDGAYLPISAFLSYAPEMSHGKIAEKMTNLKMNELEYLLNPSAGDVFKAGYRFAADQIIRLLE